MSTGDCVVYGDIIKGYNMRSLILGKYDGNKLVYKGHVTLEVSIGILNKYNPEQIEYCHFVNIPNENDNAVWLEPTLVCVAESMPNDRESFRQSVFKGFRDDKEPHECKITKY